MVKNGLLKRLFVAGQTHATEQSKTTSFRGSVTVHAGQAMGRTRGRAAEPGCCVR